MRSAPRGTPPFTRGRSQVPLKYTDRSIRGVPWWRSHVERHVWSDPNPMPHGMPHLFVRRRRGSRRP